jgi:hypothetical protein
MGPEVGERALHLIVRQSVGVVTKPHCYQTGGEKLLPEVIKHHESEEQDNK